MKRRTFLKALGLGSALIPVITKAATKPKPYTAKDVEVFVGGEKVIPFDSSVQWRTNLDDRVHTGPPEHINCRCTTEPLNTWAEKTPDEIISDLDEVFNKLLLK